MNYGWKVASSILGGLFYWILKGFKTRFSAELSDRYLKRNLITGGIIILIVAFILIKREQIQDQRNKSNNIYKIEVKYINQLLTLHHKT